MTPRALLSSAGIFSLVLAVSGGCDRREETASQRAPRVVGSSAELFALDDAGTAKDEHVVRELVGDWTAPAAIETVRPPPRKVKRVEAAPIDAPPKDEVVAQEPALPPPSPPPPSPVNPAPAERRVPTPQAKGETTWQTLPDQRNPRADAINVSVAIGTIAVGMGSATATGDNSPGARAFAIGSLGVGVVSLSTALVLYLTEPSPKPGTKTSGVTVTPGVLGLRGTF